VDTTVIVAIISASGVVLTAVFTLLGVRYTQRSTRAAARRTEALERTRVDAQAFENAKATWRENVADLRDRVDELAVENERQRDTIRGLRIRIEELETGQDRDRAHIRDLTAYARALLRILGENGIAYPDPPPGLEER
jgi:septal ring factor EnvC (AmiA/AmiB activator)